MKKKNTGERTRRRWADRSGPNSRFKLRSSASFFFQTYEGRQSWEYRPLCMTDPSKWTHDTGLLAPVNQNVISKAHFGTFCQLWISMKSSARGNRPDTPTDSNAYSTCAAARSGCSEEHWMTWHCLCFSSHFGVWDCPSLFLSTSRLFQILKLNICLKPFDSKVKCWWAKITFYNDALCHQRSPFKITQRLIKSNDWKLFFFNIRQYLHNKICAAVLQLASPINVGNLTSRYHFTVSWLICNRKDNG